MKLRGGMVRELKQTCTIFVSILQGQDSQVASKDGTASCTNQETQLPAWIRTPVFPYCTVDLERMRNGKV